MDLKCHTLARTHTHNMNTHRPRQIHTQTQRHIRHTHRHRYTFWWVPSINSTDKVQGPLSTAPGQGLALYPLPTSLLLSDLHTLAVLTRHPVRNYSKCVSRVRAGGNDIYSVRKYYLTDLTPPARKDVPDECSEVTVRQSRMRPWPLAGEGWEGALSPGRCALAGREVAASCTKCTGLGGLALLLTNHKGLKHHMFTKLKQTLSTFKLKNGNC